MEASPTEETQLQTTERKGKVLNGFLQYYHLCEWAVTVTFIRKSEQLVFEFVKNVKKESPERSILHSITRRLAQKKSSVNWSELLLSTELRCTASFASDSELETLFSKLTVSASEELTYKPLVVNLIVIVDASAPIAAHLPPLDKWKKDESVTVPEEVFSFPSVLVESPDLKGVVQPAVEGKKEFYEKLHAVSQLTQNLADLSKDAANNWESVASAGSLPGSGNTKPFVLYNYEEVCKFVKTQPTLKPYENVIKERTDLTGMKLMLWADSNLPLNPPNKFESFVNQLRVVLAPKGYLQISPFEYIKSIGNEYNENLEKLNQELLSKFGLSLHYIIQFWESRKEKKDTTPKKELKTKTSKSAKHLDYTLVYQLPITLGRTEKESRFALDSCPQYSLYFAAPEKEKEWKEKWTVKGVEHDSSKVEFWWKGKNGEYHVTLCHCLGKVETLGSTRRQFGESPADTAIRKLNSDLYGYFPEAALEKFRASCVPENSEPFGGYSISFSADPVDLPDNFVEEITKLQSERAAASDGEILFSPTQKYWAGTHNFSVPNISENDARISVGPPSSQLNWLLARERPLPFLKKVPTLYATPLKLPQRPPQPQQPGAPQQPPQQPQPTKVAKVTNRPYALSEEALKVFFGPLTVEGTRSFGRTVLVKFSSFEELAKALNADGMFFGLSGPLRVEPSTEEEFNSERKSAPNSPDSKSGRGGSQQGGRGGRGGSTSPAKGGLSGSPNKGASGGRGGRGGRGRGGF